MEIKFIYKDIVLANKEMAAIPEGIEPTALRYSFHIEVDTRVNPELKDVLLFVSVVITDMDRGTKLASINILNVFEIPDFENVITQSTPANFVIPDELDRTFRT